ncbi:MAG TPA: tetratricopeptide repeat protein [Pseudonocardiaceae bacterium]|nr:tetratricopeptide repeat protein [Pseudonocardiaceae bacterium]
MLNFYLFTAYNADRAAFAFSPAVPMPTPTGTVFPLTFADEQQATAWCLRERRNLVASVHYAAERGYHDIAWRLPHTTLAILRRHGYLDDARATLKIGAASGRAIGDSDGEGASLNDLGHIHVTLGDHAEARKLFHLATYIAQAIRSERGVAASLCNVAFLEMIEGDYPRAIELYQEAYDAAQQLGDPRMQSVAQHQLGNAYRAVRQYDIAITYYLQALTQRQTIGHRRGQGETLTELAALHCERAEHAIADAYGQRALGAIESVQDIETGQRLCDVLAEVHHHRGDLPQAILYGRRAVHLAQRIRNATKEARALENLSRSLLAADHLDAAVEGYEQALAIYRDLGRTHNAQRIAGRLADLAPPNELPDAG